MGRCRGKKFDKRLRKHIKAKTGQNEQNSNYIFILYDVHDSPWNRYSAALRQSTRQRRRIELYIKSSMQHWTRGRIAPTISTEFARQREQWAKGTYLRLPTYLPSLPIIFRPGVHHPRKNRGRGRGHFSAHLPCTGGRDHGLQCQTVLMAYPGQASSLQGSHGADCDILAANDLGIGSGWRQSKQN